MIGRKVQRHALLILALAETLPPSTGPRGFPVTVIDLLGTVNEELSMGPKNGSTLDTKTKVTDHKT
jgi:hypothetical protein